MWQRLLDAWTEVAAVDHHCHPLWRWTRAITPGDLRAVFTESRDVQAITTHVPATVVYQDALRRLAALFGCTPTEDDVLAERARADPAIHAGRLLRESGTDALLVDFGFADGDTFDVHEQHNAVVLTQREVIRLEQVGEQLIDVGDDAHDWAAAVCAELGARVAGGAVAVKSIAAYRAGLQLADVDVALAANELRRLRQALRSGDAVRLMGAPLCHMLLRAAATTCAALGVPLQVHCGFGDIDGDLASSSPLGLRPLLLDPACGGLQLVLLHCYPFHREAAYMCAVYPGVCMDLSLTLPLAGPDGTRALDEALGLCPWTKLLYATDASRLPEMFFVAASVHREALARTFGRLVERGVLSLEQADGAGVAVLRDNARRIYAL